LSRDTSAAVREHKRSVRIIRAIHDRTFEAVNLAYLAEAELAAGNVRAALTASRRAASIHREFKLASPP